MPPRKPRRIRAPGARPQVKVASRRRRDLLELWTLRSLLTLSSPTQLARALREDDVLDAACLAELQGDGEAELDSARTRRLLRVRAQELEGAELARDPVLFDNLAMFGDALELDPVERDLLALTVVASTCAGLRSCFDASNHSSTSSVYAQLARVIDRPTSKVRAALLSRAVLPSARLIHVRDGSDRRGDFPLEVMDALVNVLMEEHHDLDHLLGQFFRLAPRSSLGLDDYAHLRRPVDIARAYLSRALGDRLSGVNLLLYGPPGTGKTELARCLATALGASLFEVVTEDSEGAAPTSYERRSSYLTCQRVLRRRSQTLVLFDEIEDILPEADLAFFMSRRRRSSEEKGWLNRMLEQNPVPAIWVSNTVRHLDPAMLRRFDLCLELDHPPRRARRRILERHLGTLCVSEAWKEELCGNEQLSPADLERAARVARVSRVRAQTEIELLLDTVLDAGLRARGQELRPARYRLASASYDPALSNASCDLDALSSTLEQRGRGSLLLYGPPGTGKTAFAHHLAGRVGKDLLEKRASDLLDCWLGETEKKIAHMFRQAREEQSLLLLDEADSFLRDRRGAFHSWELTQVNELLVQMERFDGLFLCSTNLVGELDAAAFRRFGLKIKFDALDRRQRWELFVRTLGEIGAEIEECDRAQLQARLERIDRLTPGDFAAARRGVELVCARPGARELLQALEEERELKPGSGRAIGFGER